MKRTNLRQAFAGVFVTLLVSCAPIQLVAPYDEEIYSGITEYKALLNKHVKDMAVLNGTLEGTFEANQLKYNELEVKIDLLVDRASLQSTGLGCSLPSNLSNSLKRYMNDGVPPELANAQDAEEANSYGCTQQMLVNVRSQLDLLKTIHRDLDKCELIESHSELTAFPSEVAENGGDIDDIVDEALEEVWETMRTTIREKVVAHIESNYQLNEIAADEQGIEQSTEISCLRVATAQDALSISNQAINAVWVLENAKKNPED